MRHGSSLHVLKGGVVDLDKGFYTTFLFTNSDTVRPGWVEGCLLEFIEFS